MCRSVVCNGGDEMRKWRRVWRGICICVAHHQWYCEDAEEFTEAGAPGALLSLIEGFTGNFLHSKDNVWSYFSNGNLIKKLKQHSNTKVPWYHHVFEHGTMIICFLGIVLPWILWKYHDTWIWKSFKPVLVHFLLQ